MKIKSLTLHGFKSFPDRTELELHEGLTAIIGPNGCGKSNISDAIRWVLGEQRPTAIRGSRMEEAIFEGTAERKPIHRAEVEMVLTNEDGTLPVPHAEVSIGRTVFRGGESEYRLNGETCRLKDIQDLVRDTGLGANAYSIIENRMIDSILSDRAEERRAMFEEAAEIGRYKDRRRTALRRLDQARDDLDRLDDVLGEVRTKVRSLAQQRGRAERFQEYRDRRLVLEVAVARARLADLEERLDRATSDLEELEEESPADRTDLSRRETEAEELRIRIAEKEEERGRVASRLEEVRGRLEEIERSRLVARERASAAESRLETLDQELDALDGRIEELEEREERLARELREGRDGVEELRDRRGELAERLEERRRRRDRAREAREAAAERHRELRRRVDSLEASREAAGERARERRRELERRGEELETQRERVAELESDLEAAGSELEAAREALDEAAAARDRRADQVADLRDDAEDLRRRLSEARGELSAETERAEGLEALVASGEEHPAAVRELLDRDLEGVRGVLADHLEVEEGWSRAVEAELGAYLHAVLVDDAGTVDRVRGWLDDAGVEGGLVLLPEEPGPAVEPAGDGGLLAHAAGRGPASAWIRALLGDVTPASADGSGPADRWVAPDGSGRDRVGAVRIGGPVTGRGILRRRRELEAARERAREARERASELEGALEAREKELEAAREELREAEEALESAETERRRAEGERESAAHRLERARSERQELATRLEELRESAGEASREREDRDEELEGLRERLEAAGEEAEEARAELAEAESEREEAGEALQEIQLRVARAEADLETREDRLREARRDRREAEERRERLREEHREKRALLEETRSGADEDADRLDELFDERDELEAELRARAGELEEMREDLEEREAWLREARRAEREVSDRRHELELEISELRGRRANIRERLEGEWERPLEELLEEVEPPAEGGPDAWSEELETVRRRLSRIGPVNLLAAREYDEEKERLDFLESQRDDLVQARDDLQESIRRINRTAAEGFRETFEEVRDHFQRTFETLFEGGQCDLWLEDPDDPLDSPVEISASPRGKRTKRIHLLSGGERALTALALVFAIYLAKPSPFCIMDEVDAPLDETNIGRFTSMLDRFKDDTQFLVITHNPNTIVEADWVYGVTMQEPGVSSIVGVDLEDLSDVADVA